MAPDHKASSRNGRFLPSIVRKRPHDFLAAAVLLAGLALPWPLRFDVRVLIAFDAAALVFLVAVWIAMARTGTAEMARRAKDHDEGKWTALAIGVGIAVAVVVAVAAELHGMKEPAIARVALAATTIVLSWAFTNTLFALHYAHACYGVAAQRAKGLVFPGTDHPDYWDFVYFAFVVGTTFQTSDVAIHSSHIRRIVAAQGALAYFFTVVVLAISVNVVAGLA